MPLRAGRGALHRHRHRGPRRPRRRRHDHRRGRRQVTEVDGDLDHGRVQDARAARSTACSSSSAPTRTPASTRSPRVREGDKVRKGDILADGPSHRQRRAGPRQEPARGLHAVGGLQLRGRHHPLRAPGEGRRAHVDPHPRARGRRPRHQARPRGDHPGHPEPVRGDPRRPRRARHHPRRRRGRPRRRAGRQGHAQGRDRADPRGAPAAGHLRREGPRGARHLAQGAPRREGKVIDVKVFSRDESHELPPGRQPAGPGLRGPEAQDQRGRQARRPPRQQGRHLQDPARSRTCPSWPTAPPSTSSSTRSACRPA